MFVLVQDHGLSGHYSSCEQQRLTSCIPELHRVNVNFPANNLIKTAAPTLPRGHITDSPLICLPPPLSADHADCHLDECHRDQWSGARWVSRRRRRAVLPAGACPRLNFTFTPIVFFLAHCSRRSLMSRGNIQSSSLDARAPRAPRPHTQNNNIGRAPAIGRQFVRFMRGGYVL